MTQEQKELLLKDLCMRLPYETLISIDGNRYRMAEMRDAFFENFKDLIEQCKELL